MFKLTNSLQSFFEAKVSTIFENSPAYRTRHAMNQIASNIVSSPRRESIDRARLISTCSSTSSLDAPFSDTPPCGRRTVTSAYSRNLRPRLGRASNRIPDSSEEVEHSDAEDEGEDRASTGTESVSSYEFTPQRQTRSKKKSRFPSLSSSENMFVDGDGFSMTLRTRCAKRRSEALDNSNEEEDDDESIDDDVDDVNGERKVKKTRSRSRRGRRGLRKHLKLSSYSEDEEEDFTAILHQSVTSRSGRVVKLTHRFS